MAFVLENARVAGEEQLRSITIADGKISALDDGVGGKRIDCSGLTVFPGFIDIHNHGAVGVDVNSADAAGLLKIAEFLAKNGVTAWLPTLVPDSDVNYKRAIAAIDQLMEAQKDRPVAQALGVHYEGVFANEKMCGALRPQYFKNSGQWAVGSGQLPKLKKGVHMTTVAPEIDDGIELIKELRNEGWIVAIGHTKADVKILEKAFAAGARHLTHFFNAMTGLHHRDIGVAGWGLANDEVTFDIIADGMHVNPQMLELACRNKSPEKVSLISDSILAAGLGDGEYEIWGEKIVVKNGRTQNERGKIAGSVITMLDAVKRMRSLGFSESEVSKMSSLNPAKLLGIDKTRGSIAAGMRADLVAMDKSGNVKMTMIGGVTR